MPKLKFPKIKLTSRRERIAYWLLTTGFTMYNIAVIAKVSITETSAMFLAIATAIGWYILKETDRESNKPM